MSQVKSLFGIFCIFSTNHTIRQIVQEGCVYETKNNQKLFIHLSRGSPDGGVLTVPVMAEPVENGEATVPVHWNQEATAIDVTLTDRVWIDAAASTVEATVTPVTVTNNLSSVGIQVTGIQADGTNGNGYTLEDYGSDFTAYAADSHKYALAYNGADLQAGVATEDAIEAAGNRVYDFTGKMSISTADITQAMNTAVGAIVFTIGLNAFVDPHFHPTPDMLEGEAYAVLTADGDLIFFRSEEDYDSYFEDEYHDTSIENNHTVTDIKGNQYTGKIYRNIEEQPLYYAAYNYNYYFSGDTSNIPWGYDYESVLRTYVASGQAIQPLEISWWFCMPNAILIDLSGFDLSQITTLYSTFYSEAEGHRIIVNKKEFTNLQDRNSYYYPAALKYVFQCKNGEIDFTGNQLGSTAINCRDFCQLNNESIDLRGTDFSHLTDASDMFSPLDSTEGLISINLQDADFSSTEDVNRMVSTFDVLHLNMKNINFENVNDMTNTLIECDGASMIDLTNANFNSLATIYYLLIDMHENGGGHIALNNANFANVNEINGMIRYSSMDEGIVTVEAKNINFTNLQSAQLATTEYYASIIIDLEGTTFENLIDASQMFDAVSGTLDLRGMNTAHITNTLWMFGTCSKLEHIYVDPAKWNLNNVINSEHMFNGCELLPNYDANYIDASKAYVGEGGYLEIKP